MKDYKNYMDNLSVDETLHNKILCRLTQSSMHRYTKTNNLRKHILTAAYVTIILFFIISVYPHIKIWSTAPSGTGDHNLHQDKIDKSNAVYHDFDASQLIRPISLVKVPFGFFFNNKLMELVRINSGIKNNGVHWEEHKYTKNDVESALQTSVKDPNLPNGDYTIKQYVLVDEVTENIIAYQTVYYYFNINTLEFLNNFSVFYFAEQYFKSDELDQMKNVNIKNEEICISDFLEPTNVHVKVPHVRKLVYIENGISVVIEAEVDFILEDSVVNIQKSLERYKQTDMHLIDIIK